MKRKVLNTQVVVLAVPFTSIESLTNALAPALAGKIVVDTTNPLKPDFSGLATGDGPSAAERIAAALPEATVVKAFNTLFASLQADPNALGTALDALMATDDEAARATVAGLAREIGLRPVSVGPLAAELLIAEGGHKAQRPQHATQLATVLDSSFQLHSRLVPPDLRRRLVRQRPLLPVAP